MSNEKFVPDDDASWVVAPNGYASSKASPKGTLFGGPNAARNGQAVIAAFKAEIADATPESRARVGALATAIIAESDQPDAELYTVGADE